MKRAIDLAVLWIYCLVSAIFITVDTSFVVAAIGAVVYVCGGCLAPPGRGRTGLTAVFLALSGICPPVLIFVPLSFYILLDEVQPSDREEILDCGLSYGYGSMDKRRYILGAAVICLCAGFSVSSSKALVCFAAVGCVLACLLQYQTRRYALLDIRFRKTRDDGMEKNLLLREKNQSILKNQDYEIYTATLRERNRIAREIHDNVGHMLSRAILMVGAMKAVHGEGDLKGPLGQLNETLNAAMTSVRESVHDLHDESINLREVLESLVKDFTFCRAQLAYDMGYDVPREIRYGFIAIVKEALHNVAKHSDAVWVRVTAREHPGLYQLIVEDNGSAAPDRLRSTNQGMADLEADRGWKAESDRGIGLCNMQDRVDAFGGHLEIRSDRGWRIYITVPKEERRIQ